MPIEPQISKEVITQHILQRIERYEKAIINTLSYIGEECVREARIAGNYTDQTGNLRSSTGYIIVNNGEIIQVSKFSPVSRGSAGAKEGEEFVKQLARQYNKGIAIIVAVGMNYASYVANKGYNVLDSSELKAEVLIPKMLAELGLNLK